MCVHRAMVHLQLGRHASGIFACIISVRVCVWGACALEAGAVGVKVG
jgi:hypothetical protein